jgi:hypothetical protein
MYVVSGFSRTVGYEAPARPVRLKADTTYGCLKNRPVRLKADTTYGCLKARPVRLKADTTYGYRAEARRCSIAGNTSRTTSPTVCRLRALT